MIALFFLSFFLLIIINILDASYSTMFASSIVYIIGLLYSFTVDKNNRYQSVKLFLTIYSVYLISAYIFSFSFHDGNYFLMSDPLSYIEEFSIIRDNSIEFYLDYFYDCYFNLADNNALHNSYVRLSVLFAKSYLDGGGVLYLTLMHTLFGILSCTVLYKILLKYFTSRDAYKYALLFGVFSLFHFYSAVILRDIIIAFLYLLVLKIILEPFSYRGLFKLIILLLITWGIRLYSGLFIVVFILYYIYVSLGNSKYKPIIVPLFISVFIGIIISSNMVIEQSLEEIRYYQEFSTERVMASEGLSSYLINLPIGIKQIVLTLYSQFHPFPPFSPLLSASTFSQFYMSILVFIYSVWWAFIFFPLLIYLFFKGAFKKIKLEFRLLFIIALIFIMVNTAHIDVRRMMPVYPILYLIYLFIKKYIITQSYYKKVNYLIAFVFLFAISFYLILI